MVKFKAMALVPCCGELHRLAVTKQGAMVPLDHPDEQRWLRVQELGGVLPACLQYREKLFEHNAPPWHRPQLEQGPEFCEYLTSLRVVRAKRWPGHPNTQKSWLFVKVQQAVLDVFAACHYPGLTLAGMPQGNELKPVSCNLILLDLFKGTGTAHAYAGMYPGEYVAGSINESLCLRLPSHWYRHIYKAHRAIINGHFVQALLVRADKKFLYRMIGLSPAGLFYTYEHWASDPAYDYNYHSYLVDATIPSIPYIDRNMRIRGFQ